MTEPTLAARRKALIERCAEQRTGLAYELKALQPSTVLSEHPAVGYVLANRKLVLGAAGVGLGVFLLGRKRLAGLGGLTGGAMSTWQAARSALGLLARLRG